MKKYGCAPQNCGMSGTTNSLNYLLITRVTLTLKNTQIIKLNAQCSFTILLAEPARTKVVGAINTATARAATSLERLRNSPVV